MKELSSVVTWEPRMRWKGGGTVAVGAVVVVVGSGAAWLCALRVAGGVSCLGADPGCQDSVEPRGAGPFVQAGVPWPRHALQEVDQRTGVRLQDLRLQPSTARPHHSRRTA